MHSTMHPSSIDQISVPTTLSIEEDRQDKSLTLQEIQEALTQVNCKKASGNDYYSTPDESRRSANAQMAS
ncbi:unnamed protein product [Rotaria sp. Silwood2]|nr:unnamed protein product [Rotaria sp. Silwood2]CAF3087433.1 unnamed protein product [Rotaria sp. Silwood2]CAF3462445.1 unnamed protein product [Rotaria sp. Silwood2]CAF4454255.1 unnamed protein product [Rotaria sp. Silwood2]CAF4464406.1 unnamed protein product [Rotaria sp. Silwood2]